MNEKKRSYREIAEDLVRCRIKHNLPGIRDVEEQLENLKKRWGPEEKEGGNAKV
jgi:hypothetical protein